MRIQHNISALNSHRNLGINNNFTGKNLEKLSSGYRINRAGDDAAGLAISEKMRGQIRGLAMSEQNTSMGINLIQTAEGGLNETHAILQRMRELAVQSSNGTFQEEDRLQLTEEFEALKSEVDRISTSTHYNGIKLLNGDLAGDKANNLVDADSVLSGKVSFGDPGTAPLTDGQTYTAAITKTPGAEITPAVTGTASTNDITINLGGAAEDDIIKFDFGGKTYTTAALGATPDADAVATAMVNAIKADAGYADQNWEVDNAAGVITVTAKADAEGVFSAAANAAVEGFDITNIVNTVTAANVPTAAAVPVSGTAGTNATYEPATYSATFNGETLDGVVSGDKVTFSDATSGVSFTIDSTKIPAANTASVSFDYEKGKPLVFQIGANGGDDQRVKLNVDDMSSASIGYRVGDKLSDGTVATDSQMLSDASINTIDDANVAIDIITGATNMVSTQRAGLGALQNRLEHTMNNLGVTKENLTASEATIRDVDMAAEMMDFTKNNILVQAAQAMLAQANQLPQGVLQLLR